jgi:beta-lactam-binding protein with PASTA domain/tRNA A-37 threonylcarbamoyl transferase component Bud32
MSERNDTEPGALFDGRYRIQRRLGKGGMARVYLAEDESLDRQVAIKILADRHSDDPHFVERFQREARAAARLNHPNLVQIYDQAQVDGTSYIVMEYVEGETLKDLIRRDAPLDPRQAIGIALQVLAALRVAHQAGIVHRDIKPQNILVQPDGRVKVADFGIARAEGGSDMTEAGSIVGTAQYLAPEQAQGLPLGPPADLYSMGIVLYEMLNGRVPFEGDSAVTIAMKHVQEPPEQLTDRNPLVPPGLEAVVMRALAKNPAQRYQTAEEMGIDLDRVRQGLPVSEETMLIGAETVAHAPRITETMIQPRTAPPPSNGRNRNLWGVLAVIGVIALALVIALAVWASTRGGEPTPTTTTTTTAAEVQVPDLVGLDREGAIAALERLGLEALVIEVESDEAPEGAVLTQRPVAGTTVETGSTVEIEVVSKAATVQIPDVRALTAQEAVDALEAAGFIVRQITQTSSSVPVGDVISQSPSPGQRIARGSTVEITVSSGAEQATVPGVVGSGQGEAENAIVNANLVVGSVTSQTSAEPAGTVIGQNPSAGTQVEIGSSVSIVVSSGGAPAPVPSVVNSDRATAEQTIRDAGFSPSVEERAVTDPAQDGIVISQNPASGTERPEGSTVSIVVGRFTGR